MIPSSPGNDPQPLPSYVLPIGSKPASETDTRGTRRSLILLLLSAVVAFFLIQAKAPKTEEVDPEPTEQVTDEAGDIEESPTAAATTTTKPEN